MPVRRGAVFPMKVLRSWHKPVHWGVIMMKAVAVMLKSAGENFGSPGGRADETCMSPYMAKIVGQEDYVYIWTLGMEGVK